MPKKKIVAKAKKASKPTSADKSKVKNKPKCLEIVFRVPAIAVGDRIEYEVRTSDLQTIKDNSGSLAAVAEVVGNIRMLVDIDLSKKVRELV